MNELDRLSPNKNYETHDMSAALSQYLAGDGPDRSITMSKGKVEAPTHNYLGVAADIGNGVVNEVVNEPLKVLTYGAEGALAGAAFRYAPTPIRGAMLIGSLAVGAYDLSENAPKWISDASTVVNGSTKNALELAQAHANLEHLGGGIADFGAGLGGFSVGMRIPELRTAIANPINAYRSGAIPKEQIFSEMNEQLKTQYRVKIDWNKEPDWVKPAMESLKPRIESLRPTMDAVASKVADLSASGERALSSPVVQRTTGVIKSGAEQVRSFWNNRIAAVDSNAPAEPVTPEASTVSTKSVMPETTSAPAQSATPETTLQAEPVTPKSSTLSAEPVAQEGSNQPAKPISHEGFDRNGNRYTIEEEPDHFAPESVGARAGRAAATESSGENRAAPKVYEGRDSKGRPFTVEEEPDHFAAPSMTQEVKTIDRGVVFHAGPNKEGQPYNINDDLNYFKSKGAGEGVIKKKPEVDLTKLTDPLLKQIRQRRAEIARLSNRQLNVRLTEVIKNDPDQTSPESILLWDETVARLNG